MIGHWNLAALAAAVDGRLLGEDVAFDAVSTDSRRIVAGQLFVALSGERFDGHDYLPQVAAQGAVAALVERPVADSRLPQLQVIDSRRALGQLGALNRDRYQGLLAAVTGSSGKTTVKEMLAAILRAAYPQDEAVLATAGNLNNELGVPLTLLRLAEHHQAAVVELGASHVGEIAYTVGLTRPQVSIITNAGNAHVGEFGGPQRIVEAKGEILDGLDEQGIAILNRDDQAFGQWQARAGQREVRSFAIDAADANYRALDIGRDPRGCVNFRLQGRAGEARIQLNLLGRHNVLNALAAIAAADALGVALADCVSGLQQLAPVPGRCVAQLTAQGLRVIDDSYNANPVSMQAAVDILAGFEQPTVLVLGDMGELGEWAEQGHREVGAYAKGKVSALYAVGPWMRHAVATFGDGARHFDDQAQLIAALEQQPTATTILIKGSRSAAMDNVVRALCGSTGETH